MPRPKKAELSVKPRQREECTKRAGRTGPKEGREGMPRYGQTQKQPAQAAGNGQIQRRNGKPKQPSREKRGLKRAREYCRQNKCTKRNCPRQRRSARPMGRRSARINSQNSRKARARRYITGAKNAKEPVNYKTQKKKVKKGNAMVQIKAGISPSLWGTSCLIMGIAIIGTDSRSGQSTGAPTRPPPQRNDSLTGQMMEGASRQPQASATRRTEERSIEETLVSIIPGVGGVFQLLNSPHLMGDLSRTSTVGRSLGKRDTKTVTPTQTPEQNTPQAAKWNRIHSSTCETHKDCANISFCAENHTCLPQGRFIMGCIAVVVIIGSGISACICCPCPGLMGC
jgi:hypothetical protein